MTDIDLTDVKTQVRRHWEGRAATFDDTASHGLLTDEQRVAWTGCVQNWAGPDPSDTLDVGCGTGFFARPPHAWSSISDPPTPSICRSRTPRSTWPSSATSSGHFRTRQVRCAIGRGSCVRAAS